MTKGGGVASEDEHPYCKPPPSAGADLPAAGPGAEAAEAAADSKPIMEWSENFQDLSIFCNFGSKMAADNKNMRLQSGEQLDTPIITVNDEFDFGLRSSSRVSQQQLLADASLDDTDPWGDLQQQQQQQPTNNHNNNPQSTTAANNNNNTKQWESVTDWLCSSPKHIDYEPPTSTVNTFGDEELTENKHFADSTKLGQEFAADQDQCTHYTESTKLGEDFVSTKLEQDFGLVGKDPTNFADSTKFGDDDYVVENPVLNAENKEQTIDIVELLKSANNRGGELMKSINNSNRMQQYIGGNKVIRVPVTSISNTSRMPYSSAGKVVDGDKMQYSVGNKVTTDSARMQYPFTGNNVINKVADISNSSRMQYSVANEVVAVPVTDISNSDRLEYTVLGVKNNSNKVSNPSNRIDYSFVGGNSNKITVTDTSNSSNSRKVLRNSLLLKNNHHNIINNNKRDPLIGGDSLSAMFKAEEPLVHQPAAPSLLGARNLKKPQLVLQHAPLPGKVVREVIEIGSESPTAANKSEMIFESGGGEYVLPDIKIEPDDDDDVEVVRSFQAPPPQKPMKKLKLDIRSANTLAAGTVLTPTTTTAVLAESLDTPDVLKPLLDGMDNPSFDLIKYCEADELAGIPSPLIVENRKTIPMAPKDFGEKKEDTYESRREPLSTIKEEDITTDESSLSFQPAGHQRLATARNSKVLPPRKKITASRKRRRTNFENYLSENSSDTYVDNEYEDETFHLPPKAAKYIQTSKSKRQRTSSKTSIVVSSPGKRKISSSGIDSDQESIISQDRYRELRDRNNEASKRSRMNRKSREMEMKEKAEKMERRNSYLKARANRLDELVEVFREAIFKLVARDK